MAHFNDPVSMIARLRRAGVRVIDDETHQSAYVAVTDDGFTLGLGRLYHSVPDHLKTTILQHELAHIVRAGDRPPADIEDKPEYWKSWNLACDAVINSVLNQDNVKELNGITYPYLRKLVPSLPEHIPETITIFKELKKQTDELLNMLSSMLFDTHDHSKKDPKPKKLKEIIARIFLDPELSASVKDAGTAIVQRDAITDLTPRAEPALSRLLQELHSKLRGISAQRVRTRSWMRQGRLPCLRGVKRIPRGRILIGVDVSGSMSAPAHDAAAVATALAASHHCAVVSWDTDVAEGITTIGGGTSIQPLWKYATTQQYDIVVVLTDCEIPDINPLPSMPILWGIYGNSTPPDVRLGDRVFNMGNKS